MPLKKKGGQPASEDLAEDSEMSVSSPLSEASTDTTASIALSAELLQQILASTQANMLAGQRALQQERLAYQQQMASERAQERLRHQQT